MLEVGRMDLPMFMEARALDLGIRMGKNLRGGRVIGIGGYEYMF